MALPPDPFGRTSAALPRTLSREGRVELLAELADDLMAGRAPDRVAAVWVGGALLAWLLSSKPAKEADLLRDFLEVAAPPRCKTTPQAIARRIWRQKAPMAEARQDAPTTTIDTPP